MSSVKYAAPATVEGACSLLAEHGKDATVLSGGQSLIPHLRQRDLPYDVLVDINDIDGLSHVERDTEQLRIGCLARHVDVATNEAISEAIPALSKVAESIGDVQVRNRGTFCGSLAEADPAGDPPTAVTLLDPEVAVTGVDGERVLDGASFVTAPHETALRENEIVTELRFQIPADTVGIAYEKWTPSEVAWSIASVGARVEVVEGRVSAARLVTGALEAKPREISTAADILVGNEPTDDVLTDAAETLGESVSPATDFEGNDEYKSELSKTVAKDALTTAVERALH